MPFAKTFTPSKRYDDEDNIRKMRIECMHGKILLSANKFLNAMNYNGILYGFKNRGQIELTIEDLDALIEDAVEAKNQWNLENKGNEETD